MIAQNSGSIVTLGSITGMATFPLPAYLLSKTASMRLTQILAVEMGLFVCVWTVLLQHMFWALRLNLGLTLGCVILNTSTKPVRLKCLSCLITSLNWLIFFVPMPPPPSRELWFPSTRAGRLRQLISHTLVVCPRILMRDQLNCKSLYELKHSP